MRKPNVWKVPSLASKAGRRRSGNEKSEEALVYICTGLECKLACEGGISGRPRYINYVTVKRIQESTLKIVLSNSTAKA